MSNTAQFQRHVLAEIVRHLTVVVVDADDFQVSRYHFHVGHLTRFSNGSMLPVLAPQGKSLYDVAAVTTHPHLRLLRLPGDIVGCTAYRRGLCTARGCASRPGTVASGDLTHFLIQFPSLSSTSYSCSP